MLSDTISGMFNQRVDACLLGRLNKTEMARWHGKLLNAWQTPKHRHFNLGGCFIEQCGMMGTANSIENNTGNFHIFAECFKTMQESCGRPALRARINDQDDG